MTTRTCIACGMPMAGPSDHAGGEPAKRYCVHCARPDGSMQDFEEKVRSLCGFIARTRGLPREEAERVAREELRRLPAWRGRP